MLNDLATAIQDWQEEGDWVLLLADMNDDVSGAAIQEFCRTANLVEAIQCRHGKAAVLTHQRGSTAIDGIFVSPSLADQMTGGFLKFGKVTISDHRAVWLDIPAASIGLESSNQITRPAGRQLKCDDPQIVARYNQHLNQSIQEHQVITKIQQVYQEGITFLSPTQIAQYNTINRIYTEAQIVAEWKCQKFHAGNIPWTPSLMQAIYRILYWKGIRKRLTGRQIATVVLQQRAQ